MKVLIADDSKFIRERIIKLLISLNKIESFEETESVIDTVDVIRSRFPNIVILDIQLKDGTGIDVLKEIKNDDHLPLIIVLTNYSFKTYRKEFLRFGVKLFFDKSEEFIKVKDVIRELVKDKE